MRRPERKDYMGGDNAMLICVRAHDLYQYKVPTPTSALPLPTNCGTCGESYLDACAKCHHYFLIEYFDRDFHRCGAPIPWAPALKLLDAAEKSEAERAARGPGFRHRVWTHSVQDALVEGLHLTIKNAVVAIGTFLAGCFSARSRRSATPCAG